MSDWYFVITSSADGIHIDRIDEQELLNRFNAEGEDRYYGDQVPTIPENFSLRDLEYGGDKLHIIKGDFIELKPKQVVQEWEIG